jgi:Excinuclease ATPase subunit
MLERRYKETESNAMRQSMARFLTDSMCPECKGSRLNQAASNVKINQFNIHTITSLPLDLLIKEIKQLKLSGQKATIAASILKEVISRLTFLINVGLNYLTLNRSAESLSGGEAQRIRLASQIGSGLVGVIYVLDEPSIGLHSRDNARLIETLRTLQSIGNTVIVVEHDEDTMLSADQVIDIGPGAGVHGGEVIFQGTPQSILTDKKSLTGQYLSGKKCIAVPKTRKAFCADPCISIKGAYAHNLQKIDVTIPVGLMTCVTGVSGSGNPL